MSVRKSYAPALLVPLLTATACTVSETERLDAISELEAHCGLPPGVLVDTFARAESDQKKRAEIEVRSEDSRLIYFGSGISDQRLLAKSDCIKSFRSEKGFWFNFHAISPTEI